MLQDADFERAADALQTDVPSVKALAHVESNGDGFLPDGRSKILFEAQHFHKLTQGKFDADHPNISSPVWNRHLYKGGAAEWDRLEEAIELDREAALKSASYGAFQILGENFKACGFASVEAFVEAMKTDTGQLDAFVNFIKANHIDGPLRRHEWDKVARLYNGPQYAANQYDQKLAAAYAEFCG